METFSSETIKRTREICKEISSTLAKKNEDYGDSFHTLFLQEGLAASRIRLGDKYSRFCTLTRKADEERKVKDESIRDTLLDMAGYAILTIAELDRAKDADSSQPKLPFEVADPYPDFSFRPKKRENLYAKEEEKV